MDIVLQVLLAFYILFIGVIGSIVVYLSLAQELDEETAWCEFETFGGGGTLCFELKDLKLA